MLPMLSFDDDAEHRRRVELAESNDVAASDHCALFLSKRRYSRR